MANRRKKITLQVVVSVPAEMSVREARREVKTLISEQCNYASFYGKAQKELGADDVRAVSVREVKTRAATATEGRTNA